MRIRIKVGAVYCLIEPCEKIRDMDAATLVEYLDDGYAHYQSAEEAEEGRQNGDAYDEPGKTRVVGFKIIPFLPRKKKMRIRYDA